MTTTTATRVKLGRTGLDVSPICFGAWQLAPEPWGQVSDDDGIAAIRRAFEVGVNFFDTANAYGKGHSERVVGKAMAQLPRDQVVLATKAYTRWTEDGRSYGDLSRKGLIAQCEESLERLQMDYVDLYQCHSHDDMTHPAETADAMETLVKQGKIRCYGSSNWTVEQMRTGDKFGNFATCQPKYSLLHRDAEKDVLPYCVGANTGVLVYSPLHQGLLTGKYKADAVFTDFRGKKADFKGDRFKLICDKVAQACELATSLGMTMTQLTLVATLMHPGITCTICGTKRPEQIEDAAGAMGRTIPREDWYQLRSLLNIPKE